MNSPNEKVRDHNNWKKSSSVQFRAGGGGSAPLFGTLETVVTFCVRQNVKKYRSYKGEKSPVSSHMIFPLFEPTNTG